MSPFCPSLYLHMSVQTLTSTALTTLLGDCPELGEEKFQRSQEST